MDKKTLDQLACKAKEYNTFETEEVMTWCGGCGNYSIQNALKRALVLENIAPKDTLCCFDVGCSGNGSDKIETYTIHGLHGRVLPLAVGAKIANEKLHVIASAGDGATLSEGVNHLIHAVRSDYPILFLHHDNQNYALTTGQASATTPQHCTMNGTPQGVKIDVIDPLDLVLATKPSFVAQTISSDVDHMTEMIREGLSHKGFAFLQILQSCPTYNKIITDKWLLENTERVEDISNYDQHNLTEARALIEKNEKIPLGVLYRNPRKENFIKTLSHREGAKTSLIEEVKAVDITSYVEKLRG
jgi:2-oxoglutarate/2-oxoacid ferredoxin oxidoreductase subunit beta